MMASQISIATDVRRVQHSPRGYADGLVNPKATMQVAVGQLVARINGEWVEPVFESEAEFSPDARQPCAHRTRNGRPEVSRRTRSGIVQEGRCSWSASCLRDGSGGTRSRLEIASRVVLVFFSVLVFEVVIRRLIV